MGSFVVSVAASSRHTFSKRPQSAVTLLAGRGVAGDAHEGETVQHRSRVRRDPGQANLRQVHLVHAELHEELAEAGFVVRPGDIGENITTRGVDLLNLPRSTLLHLGDSAVVEVTGLRNPCRQLDRFQSGLTKATLARDDDGTLVRKAGIMAVVIRGGEVRRGDDLRVELPAPPHLPLGPV